MLHSPVRPVEKWLTQPRVHNAIDGYLKTQLISGRRDWGMQKEC